MYLEMESGVGCETLFRETLKVGIPFFKQVSCCSRRHDHYIDPFLGCSSEVDFVGIFNIADTEPEMYLWFC